MLRPALRRALGPPALALLLAAAPGCRGCGDAPEPPAAAPAEEATGEPAPVAPADVLAPAEQPFVGAWRLEEGPAERLLLIVERGRRVFRSYRDGRPHEVGTWGLDAPSGPLTLRPSAAPARTFERARAGDTLVLEGAAGTWRGIRER